MIVKDEVPVVRRCLASVVAHVDAYAIVDTGSTDGTQDIVRRFFQERGVPGVLRERPWRDFGSNRNEALALAAEHGDYAFVMDADDVFVPAPGFSFDGLHHDAYRLTRRAGAVDYAVERLVRTDRPWRWHGVLHEVLACDAPARVGALLGCVIDSRCEGARSRDPHKYRRDAQLLERELAAHPGDPRTLFYLAQSYRDAGDDHAAARTYLMRARAGGWDEEVYCALYQLACCLERLGEDWPTVLDAYLAAHAFRPARVESLHAAVRACRARGLWSLGYRLALPAVHLSPTQDLLFVEREVVEWRLLDELAVCATWIGRWAEAAHYHERLLRCEGLRGVERERVAANARLCRERLG